MEKQTQARKEKMFAALSEEEKKQLLSLMEKLWKSWETSRKTPPEGNT